MRAAPAPLLTKAKRGAVTIFTGTALPGSAVTLEQLPAQVRLSAEDHTRRRPASSRCSKRSLGEERKAGMDLFPAALASSARCAMGVVAKVNFPHPYPQDLGATQDNVQISTIARNVIYNAIWSKAKIARDGFKISPTRNGKARSSRRPFRRSP
jgi:hypothetical protein